MSDLQTESVDAGIREMVREAQRFGLTWILRPATVLDPDHVRYDGDNDEASTRAINLLPYPLVEDMRVMCVIVPPAGNFVIGTIGGGYGFAIESTRDTSVGTFTTTETVIQTATFNALPGMRYEVMAVQSYQSTVANDLVQVRLRWQPGASVNITDGQEFHSVLMNCDIAGRGAPAVLNRTIIPGSDGTGQVSVAVTAQRVGGTGNITMFGSAAQVNTILIKGI